MKIQAYVTLTLKDTRSGKVLSNKRFKSNSYVLAFLDILYGMTRQTSQSIKDTGGTTRSCGTATVAFDSYTGAGDTSHGIVVGTGDTPVAIDDYQLETKIGHGTGAGQLYYQTTGYIAPSTTGSRRHAYFSRQFDNQSGATITVKECGVYSKAGSNYNFCTIRDIIPDGGKPVAHNQTLTIQYEYYVQV